MYILQEIHAEHVSATELVGWETHPTRFCKLAIRSHNLATPHESPAHFPKTSKLLLCAVPIAYGM